MRILLTGSAGFIGFHVARRLLTDGHSVAGVDNLSPYYDVALKRQRHAILKKHAAFCAHEISIEDYAALERVWLSQTPDVVIHLAAQAGVRYSLEQPTTYVNTNILGTLHVLELARKCLPRHLMIASTSSVYGGQTQIPFQEINSTDEPLSLYAATKKSGEVMGHAYAHLFSIPITFMRFFTVYGPWGRPDMAPFKFTKAVFEDIPIDVFNRGDMWRDFTYIDDVVEAVLRIVHAVPTKNGEIVAGDTLSPVAPCRVVNIGRGEMVYLLDFIRSIEDASGRIARINLLSFQPGDAPRTLSSTDLLYRLTGFRPQITMKDGVGRFVNWFRDYSS